MTTMDTLAASLRASRVPAFRVMEVMKAAHERERAGGHVLHMEVGQPSVGAPPRVLDAVKESLDACARGETTLGYTVADGTDALVRARSRPPLPIHPRRGGASRPSPSSASSVEYSLGTRALNPHPSLSSPPLRFSALASSAITPSVTA
jgi:hypothetical protein